MSEAASVPEESLGNDTRALFREGHEPTDEPDRIQVGQGTPNTSSYRSVRVAEEYIAQFIDVCRQVLERDGGDYLLAPTRRPIPGDRTRDPRTVEVNPTGKDLVVVEGDDVTGDRPLFLDSERVDALEQFARYHLPDAEGF